MMMGSQPGRACLAAFKYADLPVEVVNINLFKGEHKTPEYLALNPKGQIPYCVDGNFKNAESSDTLRYIASKAPQANLYPAAHKSKIDALLNFYATVLRPNTCAPIQNMFGNPDKPSFEDCIEEMWLGYEKLNPYCKEARAKDSFLLGLDKPSIADF